MAGSSSKEADPHKIELLIHTLSSSNDLNPLIDLIEAIREHALPRFDDALQGQVKRGTQFLVKSLQKLLHDDKIQFNGSAVDGFLISSKNLDSPQSLVQNWFKERWNDSVRLLCDLLHCDDDETRVLALQSILALQRDASSAVTRQSKNQTELGRIQWSDSPWRALMHELIFRQPSKSDHVSIDVFLEEFLQEYDDVRFAFCRFIAEALRDEKRRNEAYIRPNAIKFMLGLTAIPKKDEDLNTYLQTEISRLKSKARNDELKGVEHDDESHVDNWFSDSDDEAGVSSARASSAAGLGKAATAASQSSADKRKRKKHPPFYISVRSLTAQRAAFAKAWLSILLPSRTKDDKIIGGSLDVADVHAALVCLHSQILPHLAKPNLLHDFLVDALDAGGATALLALNALYTLITKHNLNYPAFYPRLYELLIDDPPFLHVRFRSRFLRMLEMFLESPRLPAAMVASFAKRLSRAALRAPPAAIVAVIPMVWNLCKRHKRCLEMLHRNFSDDRFDAGPAGLTDPFDAKQRDPFKTGAIDSSLWELATLGAMLGNAGTSIAGVAASGEAQTHYLASVSSLSRILAEPFTKERYGLEDFLDLTYTTMFETETKKTLRKIEGKKIIVPAVAFDLPRNAQNKRKAVFGESAAIKKARADSVEAGFEIAVEEDVCKRLFAF